MRISEVIRRKGRDVVTIGPDETVAELLSLLARYGIGAVVVSGEDGTSVEGIVSERDIVRHLQSDGPDVVRLQVRAIMTRVAQTCTLEDDLETLARQMTEHRVRHIPVIVDGQLYAIVSIGDIVKHRIDELQMERDQLVGYIQQ